MNIQKAILILFATLIFIVIFASLGISVETKEDSTYYISPSGSDKKGDGSQIKPWATIGFAVRKVPDKNSVIVVKNGLYNGRIRISRNFNTPLFIRAENNYRARLTSEKSQALFFTGGARNISLEGFEIFKSTGQTSPVLVQIAGSGTTKITLKNNIIHDSFNNDIIKANRSIKDISIEGNIFYNQEGTDEHIDINGGANNVVVQDNIFFNDFEGSGRKNNNDTSSFIIIKDSGRKGTKNITVRRNIFLNWEGSSGHGFVHVGEDGREGFEADGVVVENNLMLGNSSNLMRAPFQVWGSKNVVFRNNTVTGDLPAKAYALRLTQIGGNPPSENIFIYNNIWSDPTGTMKDFSDGEEHGAVNVRLNNNLYWNNGEEIPKGSGFLGIKNDANPIIGNPILGAQNEVVLPRWDAKQSKFLSGNSDIRQEFKRLVELYGAISEKSSAINAADAINAPSDDILGNTRDSNPDIGAFEVVK